MVAAKKRRPNPPRLAKFLEREADAVKNHWFEITEKTFGDQHPDMGTYKVRFPKSPWRLFDHNGIDPAEHSKYVPFGTLFDPEGGELPSFLAVDATVDAGPVLVWDGINGEGFFPVAPSLDAWKKLLKKTRV